MRKNRVSSANLSNLPALRHGLAKEDFQSERKTPVLSVQGGLVVIVMNQKQQNDLEQLASILENIRSMDDKSKKEPKAPPMRGASQNKSNKVN